MELLYEDEVQYFLPRNHNFIVVEGFRHNHDSGDYIVSEFCFWWGFELQIGLEGGVKPRKIQQFNDNTPGSLF